MVFFMSRDTKKICWFSDRNRFLPIFIGHWFDVFNMIMPGTLFDQWELGLLESWDVYDVSWDISFILYLIPISKAPFIMKEPSLS